MKSEPKGQKEYIEAKFKRSSMSADKNNKMRADLLSVPCTVKCWSCKTYQTALQHQLHDCTTCGKNLWRRS